MLTVADRVEIAQGLKAGWSIRAIAAHIDRSPSVVSRKVRPNWLKTRGYGLVHADCAADAATPDEEPDLILVMTDYGTTGYVLKTDMDRIGLSSATNVQQGAAWNKDLAARKASGKGVSAPMYKSDGKTVVGQFKLAASTGSAATG